MAKVVGKLAAKRPHQNQGISGILVKRNFKYHIMSATDLPNYTDLAMSTVTQRQSVYYSGTADQLRYYLNQLTGDVDNLPVGPSGKPALSVFNGAVTVTPEPSNRLVVIEWVASPVTDMYADSVLAVVLKSENEVSSSMKKVPPKVVKVDKSHFNECLIEQLTEMFGVGAVNPLIRGDKLSMVVDSESISIDLYSRDVTCENESLQQMISTVVNMLHLAVNPVNCEPNKA